MLFEIRVKVIFLLVIAGWGFYYRAVLKLMRVLVWALMHAAFTDLNLLYYNFNLTQYQL
jgi:hypothetical protein